MAKIFHLIVANLGNNLAITCARQEVPLGGDLRLDLKNFLSSFIQPRINQRSLNNYYLLRLLLAAPLTDIIS